MKKLLIIFMLLSGEGMAECVQLKNDMIDLPGFDLHYRCEMPDAICYYSGTAAHSYSVSCFPKPKVK